MYTEGYTLVFSVRVCVCVRVWYHMHKNVCIFQMGAQLLRHLI